MHRHNSSRCEIKIFRGANSCQVPEISYSVHFKKFFFRALLVLLEMTTAECPLSRAIIAVGRLVVGGHTDFRSFARDKMQ